MNTFESQPEAPERLSNEEVEKITSSIDDPRLSKDKDAEHFVIEHEGKETYIPKRRKIPVEQESGEFKRIDIEDYLKDLLEKLS